MRKLITGLLAAVLVFGGIAACSERVEEPGDIMTFEVTIADNYDGVGVEWDAYENPLIIDDLAWARIIERLDRLKPSLVRCIVNYRWFLRDFDDKGTPTDLSDDTWVYDWEQPSMVNAYKILDYCTKNNIKVAFGGWRALEGWGNDDLHTSDIRYSKVSADLMKELIVNRGYTAIKWFVPTNEPNYLPNNTYELWKAGVDNLYAEFEAKGLLSKVSIHGTDATSMTAALEWSQSAAKDLNTKLGNYSIHLYLSDYIVDANKLPERLGEITAAIKAEDKGFRSARKLYIWEAGLIDGKDGEIDTNVLIDTFDYGLRMTDYTIQSVQGGADGIVYWNLDDAMHFLPSGATKNWGMFSSLGPASQQELRPWFHSSALTSAILRPSNKVMQDANSTDNFRAVAALSPDGKDGGYILVNRGGTEITKQMRIPSAKGNKKLYIYIYKASQLKLDSQGYAVPNYEVNGGLNDILEVKVPAGSAVFVTTHKV